MKVTQEEFNAKRRELSGVQAKRQDARRTLDMYAWKEICLQTWLEGVDIKEDLSVDLEGVRLERKGERSPYIDVRGSGNYQNKGYYLASGYNWKTVTDNQDSQVLVPTKKPS